MGSLSHLMLRLGLVLILLCAAPGPVQAQTSAGSAAASDWDGPLLSEPVSAIFTPTSGALIVRTSNGLERSDDGGETFHNYPLPPYIRPDLYSSSWSVDPKDQNVLYATGDELLYQSTDAGLTWRPILTISGASRLIPTPANCCSHRGLGVGRFAISPADSSVLYAWVGSHEQSERVDFNSFALLGSRDRGASWTTLYTNTSSSVEAACVLQGHPTNVSRVFLAAGCYGGHGTFSKSLQQSTDQGKTLQDWWKADYAGPLSGFPRSLVGGQGAAPSRWYLAFNRDSRIGGSAVVRSDDDGTTWAPILSFDGGGGYGPGPDSWDIEMAGLAEDPSAPDILYVARTAFEPHTYDPRPVQTSGVAMTTDGGVTWSDLGSQQLGQLNDLALGIDGKNLYLASDQGLFRLRLQASSSPAGGHCCE